MSVSEDSTTARRFLAFPPARGTGLTMRGMYKFSLGWVAAMVATILVLNLYLWMAERFHWEAGTEIVGQHVR